MRMKKKTEEEFLKAGNNNVRLIRSDRNANVYGTTGLLTS